MRSGRELGEPAEQSTAQTDTDDEPNPGKGDAGNTDARGSGGKVGHFPQAHQASCARNRSVHQYPAAADFRG